MTNGFRVYSPDGAQWTTTTADTLPLGWENMFNLYYSIYYYSDNGSEADTVGFTGIGSPVLGLPAFFDEISYTITIGPIDDSYDGKTICLDSSFYGGTGYWSWAYNGGTNIYYPSWDGPHCFTIQKSQITFSGYLYYLDPVPPDTNQMPMRDVMIEMWDDDDVFDDSLDAAVTYDNGYFILGPVDNDDGLLGGGLDIFFRIYAENEATYVTENYNGDTITMQTAVGNDLPGGVYDTTIVAPLDSSGPYFVADAVLEARDSWLQIKPNFSPDQIQVVLESAQIGTKYYPQQDYIRIENATSFPNAWPDTYDKDAIFHEYGHKIEVEFEFFDEGGGPHSWWTLIDSMTASLEGCAHFLCNVFNNSPVSYNFYPNFYDTAWYNSENGEWGFNSTPYGSSNCLGKMNEASVVGMLWDIYDIIDDDYSSQSDWGSTTLPHTSDSIYWDTLSDGIDNILTALMDNSVYGHRPDNIDEFWFSWFASVPFPSHGVAMGDIWYEHGELAPQIPGCCNGDGKRGNVDGQSGPGGEVDVADLSWLVDYLMRGGPVPPCTEEGNVDGQTGPGGIPVDVADLSYLADFLFRGGPPPAACP